MERSAAPFNTSARAEWSGSTPGTIPIAAEYHRPARIPAGVHRLFLVSSRPRVIYGLGPAAGARSTTVRRRARARIRASTLRRERRNIAEPREPSTFPTLRHGDVHAETVLRAFALVVATEKSLSPTDRLDSNGRHVCAPVYDEEKERCESDGTVRALITT